MSERSILFVNQTPNRMLNDIAMVYKEHGWNTVLFSGSLPPAITGFSQIARGTPYDRAGYLSRLKSWWKFTAELKQFVKSETGNFHRLFLVSNPPFILYLGTLLKKYTSNADVQLLVYDLYPDVFTSFAGKISKFVIKPAGIYNRLKFRVASKVFTPSDTLSKAVHRYFKGPVQTVYNWVDLQHILPVDKSDNKFLELINAQETFNVLYSGNLGKTHDSDTIAAAAIALKDPSIRFILIGHGTGIEKIKSLSEGDTSLKVYDLQPEDLFPHSIASGDVALISYLDGAEGYSIPSKLPYYFATGTPVIMIGNPESELAKLITFNGLGWCVPNHRQDELIRLLSHLKNSDLSSFRQRVREYVKQNWSENNAKLFYSE